MAKTCIFYGSETGTTADIARRIAKELGVSDADIHDVADTAPDRLGDYDLLILGSSTWGAGEVAGGWYDFLAGASALDLTRKQIALFGCGDESMCDTFCNAVGEIYDARHRSRFHRALQCRGLRFHRVQGRARRQLRRPCARRGQSPRNYRRTYQVLV